MGRRPELPKCQDARPDCFARTNDGKCFCLRCTIFDGPCPFYKTEAEVKTLVVAQDYKEAKNK